MSSYDRFCNNTEEWTFLNFHKELLQRPDPSWHFDRDELNRIAIIYYKLQRDASDDLKQDLPIKDFSLVLHTAFGISDSFMVERICTALDLESSRVPLRAWISLMSLFLRGSIKQKINFCFKVYDIKSRNEIRRAQMLILMRKFMFKHQEVGSDDELNELVGITLSKLDADANGIISYEDFLKTVLKEPLLLECLGHCLPDPKHVLAFLMTFTDKIKVD